MERYKNDHKTLFLNINIIAKIFFEKDYKVRSITTPNTMRYIINILKPWEEKYLNKKLIANNEDKKVVIRQTISWDILIELNSFKEEINSTIAAREIAGIPKRKENLAASPLSQPEMRAVEIVTPDLETPGKTAKACERPIRKLCE